MKTYYTLGFMFSPDNSNVALISKTHPEWQKGLLNGIGGKVETAIGELPLEGMVREFREETGYHTAPTDWRFFCKMDFFECNVYCYKANGILEALKSTTDEQIQIIPTDGVKYFPTIHNLRWLIPLAIEGAVAETVYS
jgi:8-oxo-dGTP diphosphatase